MLNVSRLSLYLLTMIVISQLGSAGGQPQPASATQPRGAEPAAELDPRNATWHIGLPGMLGVNKKDQGIALDIYQVFQDGKAVNALGSARNYNTSMHLVRRADLVMDLAQKTLAGTMEVTVTPDPWVPADGRAFAVVIDVKGELTVEPGQCRLGGTYTARRPDGLAIYGDVKVVEGKLIGGAGPNHTGWENAVWRLQMTQIRGADGMDKDAVDVTLGIADGKVRWGLIGVTAEPAWPATKRYPFDVSGFGPVSNVGIAKGSAVVTARHIHPGGDPRQPVRMDLVVHRVGGLSGGEATFTALEGGQPKGQSTQAFGRGKASKGGGETVPSGLWVHDLDDRPWWTPIADFKAVAPGEHPRLLFRKGDLAGVQKRAETPEGKAILARLRKLLDGKNGDTLPTVFSPTPPDNHRKSPPLPIGAFTSFHGAGYGFLYQMTGDKKYADLARQSVELMFEGKYDIDNRYSWVMPGTDLRCGQLLAAVAYAYDFCYDAWPAEFRTKVALEIQNYDKKTATGHQVTIAHLVGRSKGPPGSNHYGSLIGGTGVALLAILGDPGVDSRTVELRLSEAESNIPRMLELGFGDAGWFAEGFGSASGLSRVGMLPLFHAERNARGRDYLHPRPNAQWMTLFWIMHLGGDGYAAIPNRGVYDGDNDAPRDGDIASGFGAIDDKYKAALLWSYKTFSVAREPKKPLGLGAEEQSWAAERYPYAAVYSFLNWPIGVTPQNPAEVLPKVAVDRVHGYFVGRNRWQDSDDIIVTAWLEYGPQGYYSSADLRGGNKGEQRAGSVRIWGHGLRTALDTGITGGPVTHFAEARDGSFTFTRGSSPGAGAIAVDFSKASGADAVVLAVGPTVRESKRLTSPKNAKASTQWTFLAFKDTHVTVCTLQTGAAPKVSVEGDAVMVGGQRFVWDGRILKPATFDKDPK